MAWERLRSAVGGTASHLVCTVLFTLVQGWALVSLVAGAGVGRLPLALVAAAAVVAVADGWRDLLVFIRDTCSPRFSPHSVEESGELAGR
ncbi:hypothetical protein C1701_02440 [Actinoalloteichus sp. AHMU CJ021]|uniref:hypothetical protein n=1 Tax=Actinoalloteichus sp. AHMU CJ021 TaxID=2072503 RepID=UPI000CA03ED2|nr:hypothetical protein C1701_02440 [Actinoalloteichus sp. AHMU CJ021]